MKPKKPKSLKESLQSELTPEELKLIPRAFDIVGDIAIIETSEELKDKEKIIGEALLKTFKNIKVVARKASSVDTDFRLRRVQVIAGENRTETVHKEYGCSYKLNIKDTYFSPRLGTERMRVAPKVKEGESVLVMFAGVGFYPILIAKKANPKNIVAIELNSKAVLYMKDNARINKVNFKIIQGDVRKEAKNLKEKFDRIVMPLPKGAKDFLDVAIHALKKGGVIHFYTFARNLKEAEKTVKEITTNLGYKKIKILDSVYCGSYSPCLSRICVDFKVDVG